jgi:hypothetical protein
MRDVSVDTTKPSVTFGGGCLWGDVDDALWEHRLATTGGTVSHTGVGGLILHGGFGVLSGLHGLTIDCLLSAEVVLANGDIVTASETENPDLFWAIRGAGSSFGVVTSFTSKAFPQGDVWGGVMIFTEDKLPGLVEFFNFWAANNDGRQTTSMGLAHAPPGPTPDAPRPRVVLFQVTHVGDDPLNDGPKFFSPLLEMGPIMKMVGPKPYPEMNKVGDNDAFAPGRRYLFGGANIQTPLSLKTVEAIRDKFFAFSTSHPGSGSEGSLCLFEGISKNKSSKVPTDATAFNSRGKYYNIGFVWTWDDASLDGEVRTYNRQVQQEVREMGYNDANYADGVGRYLNYVSTETISAEAAFGANGKRLRGLKEKYDPNNFFDKLWKLIPQKEEQWAS